MSDPREPLESLDDGIDRVVIYVTIGIVVMTIVIAGIVVFISGIF